jgi:hypothetical protein
MLADAHCSPFTHTQRFTYSHRATYTHSLTIFLTNGDSCCQTDTTTTVETESGAASDAIATSRYHCRAP